MLLSRLGRPGRLCSKSRLSRRRLFSTQEPFPFSLDPVRVLGPTLWCIGAASTIYLGCAAYDVLQDVRDLKQQGLMPPMATFDDIEAAKAVEWPRGPLSPWRSPPPPSSDRSGASPTALWDSLTGPGKVMAGLVGVNAGVYLLERVLPSAHWAFSHTPVASANYTLFTSTFGHVGLMHLGLNMYGLVQFAPPVARSRTFENNGSHLAAFYLSSGLFATLAYHLASVWPRRMDRYIAGRGASGAIMAVVGAFGMSYPDAHLGVVLIPGSLPASQFLALVAVFETYGLFIGFRWLPFAHAAHLAGLGIGSAYVYYDGKTKLWGPARRLMFNQMKRLNMV